MKILAVGNGMLIFFVIFLCSVIALMIIFFILSYGVRKKEMEKVLVANEKWLSVLNIARLGAFEYNVETKEVVFTNVIPSMETKSTNQKYSSPLEMFEKNIILPEYKDEYLQIYKNIENGSRMESVITKSPKNKWFKTTLKNITHTISKKREILGVVEDITEQVEREKFLTETSELDFLTNLYNRRAFIQKLTDKLDESKKQALIIIDLDKFKMVNDLKGHVFGDEILKKFADILLASFCEDDIVARLGGDEFIVFLNECKVEDIIPKIEKILKNAYSKADCLTCCFGVAFSTDKKSEFQELYHKADIALYQAKQAGRGQMRIYIEENTCKVN